MMSGSQYVVPSAELETLLEDLTDYARDHGDEPLFKKLSGLAVHDQHLSYKQECDVTIVKARAMRIARVIETFGRKFVEAERSEQSNQPIESRPDVTAFSIGQKIVNKRVFVVHGHDDSVLYRVKDTLSVLGLTPVILRDQPNGGKTVIEKFETYSDVGFAVVLMTADDIGGH
jgi:predicted nucleotide-binding protein